MKRFTVGQKVRINGGWLRGKVGTFCGHADHEAYVRVDGSVRLVLADMLTDLYANNGD